MKFGAKLWKSIRHLKYFRLDVEVLKIARDVYQWQIAELGTET
jgi:hypothetical protein